MTNAKLSQLKTLSDVARACGVGRSFIEEYANGQQQSDYYSKLSIAKRGWRRKGQFRVVFQARNAELLSFHRSVAMLVANSVDFGDHVQGFRKKRSSRSNAHHHLDADIVLHADIKNFFDAITTAQVRAGFVEEGVPLDIASVMAKACTIDGLLRQGTRCSPILANLICADLDRKLLRLAKLHGAVYTRYGDNLTFSGESVPTDESIKEILEGEKFELRGGRCHRQFRGHSQYVTGLTVSDASKPRLPKRLKSRLRLIFHYIKLYGLAEHWERTGEKSPMRKESWLHGMLKYAASIEPEIVKEWQIILEEAQSERRSDDEYSDFDWYSV